MHPADEQARVRKTLLVEDDPFETRVALLENDRLAEIFIERPDRLGWVGNLYKGRVSRVLPGMQAAFVDIGLERDAFLYVGEVVDSLATVEDVEGAEPPSIGELLVQGQELLVQVLKDPLPNKGARVSTQITLPGRYLVLLPEVEQLGISRRIEDDAERERLRGVLEAIQPPGCGLIVRTAGLGQDEPVLRGDLVELEAQWQRLRQRAAQLRPPALVHRDLDLAVRVVRDTFSDDFDTVWVEGDEAYESIVAFLHATAPYLAPRVRRWEEPTPLFEHYAIDQELDKALESRVWLKSGGTIVIQSTEALVAIDVNTGRFVGRDNLEDTVLATNLEAVTEIVHQLRLRDLGGIVVIDFIDMADADNRARVMAALEAELARDRAKSKVLALSEFGLVQLTRKRSRQSLERQLTAPCPYCRGSGRVANVESIGLDIRRRLVRDRSRYRHGARLVVHPDVARSLATSPVGLLAELERLIDAELIVDENDTLHREHWQIEPLTRRDWGGPPA
ncbi:MAG: Rne/Rng family ribonuclease [Acidobacteriota bacterium]